MRQLGIAVFGVALSLVATQAFAQDTVGGNLLGAQAVLDSLPRADAAAAKPGAHTQPPGGVPAIKPGDEVFGPQQSAATLAKIEKLRAELAAFGKAPLTGAAWVALFERWYVLKHPESGEPDWSPELPLDDVLATLPPPAAWPAIAGELRKRHTIVPGAKANASQIAVLMFADQLAGDVAGMRAREAQLDALDSQHGYLGYLRDEAARAVAARAGDDAVVRFTAALQRDKDANGSSLRVPDLVTLIGEDRARELLQQTLTQSAAQLEIPVGDATRTLAGKLAVQDIGTLRRPQWNLVRGLDCAPLYEALRKRFIDGAAAPHEPSALSTALHMMVGIRVGGHREPGQNYAEESEHGVAKVYYFAALIAHGRSAEAETVAQSFGRNLSERDWRPVIDALDRAGYGTQLYDFLDGFMARHPNSDLWERYVELAARNGRQDALLAHTRASLAAPGQAYATILRAHLADALLAADKIDEAVAELRALIGDASQPAWSRANYGLKLAEIGRLCEKPEWIEQGLATAQPSDKQLADRAMPSDMDSDGGLRAYTLLLRKLGRYAEAEKLISRALAAERKWQVGSGGGSSVTTLIELAGVYHDAGRDADVLTLLDKAPNWGVADVTELRAYADAKKISILYYAAAALHHAGRDAQALPLLEALIERSSGFDPAYELYTRIRGAAAISYLEKSTRATASKNAR